MSVRTSLALALLRAERRSSRQGCSAKTTGQLVLVVQTDLALPKDIDSIEIEVSVDGVPKFKNTYQKLGTPDGQIHLPGTIDLLAPEDPTQAVDIVVSARSGGEDGQAPDPRRGRDDGSGGPRRDAPGAAPVSLRRASRRPAERPADELSEWADVSGRIVRHQQDRSEQPADVLRRT